MNSTDDVFQQLRQFVVDNFLFGNDDGLAGDSSFMEQGIIDSTGILELIGFVEQTWEIQVEDDELIPENLDSLNNLTGFVNAKLGQ
jgi:acyl carrier protein